MHYCTKFIVAAVWSKTHLYSANFSIPLKFGKHILWVLINHIEDGPQKTPPSRGSKLPKKRFLKQDSWPITNPHLIAFGQEIPGNN